MDKECWCNYNGECKGFDSAMECFSFIPESEEAASAPVESQSAGSVSELLIAVAEAAHWLGEDSEENAETGEIKIDVEQFHKLSDALMALDALPDVDPMKLGPGYYKAKAILQADSDRMDWLEDDRFESVGFNVEAGAWETDYLPEGCDCFSGSLRCCVDAAMNEQKKQNEKA